MYIEHVYLCVYACAYVYVCVYVYVYVYVYGGRVLGGARRVARGVWRVQPVSVNKNTPPAKKTH